MSTISQPKVLVAAAMKYVIVESNGTPYLLTAEFNENEGQPGIRHKTIVSQFCAQYGLQEVSVLGGGKLTDDGTNLVVKDMSAELGPSDSSTVEHLLLRALEESGEQRTITLANSRYSAAMKRLVARPGDESFEALHWSLA